MRAVLRLALLQARRDRGTTPAWILGIAGLGYAAATAVTTQFGEDNERAVLISVAAASPAFLFLRRREAGKDLGGRPRRLTDSQIRSAVRLVEGGDPAAQVARDLGMSRATFYRRSRALKD